MKTVEYLKAAKTRLGIESDYALAARLCITRSSISKLQAGKTSMGDETAIKVADILGVSRGLVLIDVHAEREKNPEIQASWRALMEKISKDFKDLISRANPRRRTLPTW